jgi:5-hydroxyisourate hydrolase
MSAPSHNAGLTTHVLDTANGKPAAGVKLELYRLESNGFENDLRTLVKKTITNPDGRTDEPLIARGSLQTGRYEIVFFVGEYFGLNSGLNNDVRFLETVPIRFGIADTSAHYHVPLLVSPWSYSTYRGS